MTETAPSVLEAVLRRDRTVVVAALVMVVGLSWLWIALGAGMEMSAVEMTRMPRDMVMTPAAWTPAYAALMFAMWSVMMVAMMLRAPPPSF
jgi:predicted metal-binding membrane protein